MQERIARHQIVVWTIGHSTRSFEEFFELLREHSIGLLIDIRHFPSSERVPWATKAALAQSLPAHGIGYEHLEDLGGYRTPRADSVNTGWRSRGFRGYADHMATEAFRRAFRTLIGSASTRRTAVMCAKAVPFRCHRRLLSDAVVALGGRVVHILSPGKARDHRLTRFAKVHGGRVTYPAC